ncbi:DUF305 domain-containing protein [Kribbella jiaozuonensis]|uniref:DUF305 domain-containing protein n=1 Tax=Kribbella jiaozuonensis TaxID=2575441 RepID=A0A4U3LKZ9_9ACTN|nr:DUF305 domain-containing protein [Kribbella jiaozuonensis]TKK76405.1 DUF305 domain-containing protein [Kribbella jiaozuonensis]
MPIRRTLLHLTGALTACVAAGALTACSPSTEPASSRPAPAPAIQSTFNPTDAAWLELMIPMDEQFLHLLDLVPSHSTNPAVRRLAAGLTPAHRTELAALTALRTQAGLPTANPHEGHDMPGMMTADEVVALSNLTGAAFDRTLTTEIQDHLTQSALITRSVKAAGHAPAVKTLATRIEKDRTAQLVFVRTTAIGNQTPLP